MENYTHRDASASIGARDHIEPDKENKERLSSQQWANNKPADDKAVKGVALPQGLPALNVDAYDFHQGIKKNNPEDKATDPYDFHQGPKEKGHEKTESSYKIKSGDTLWAIAEKQLEKQGQKDASSSQIWAEINKIAKLNNIADPNLIYTGATLRLAEGRLLAEKPQATAVERVSLKQDPRVEAKPFPSSKELSSAAPLVQRSSAEIHTKQLEAYSCSSSSMQMALSAYGLRPPGESARQDLLREMRASGKVAPGQGFYGGPPEMADEMRRHGMEAIGVDTTSVDFLDEQLNLGRTAIVNGGRILKAGGVGGHFIYVYGQDSSGNYQVNDPVDSYPSVWSKAEMAAFLSRKGEGRRGVTAVWLNERKRNTA